MKYLYGQAQKHVFNEWKFQAGLHGVNLDEQEKEVVSEKKDSGMLFKEPGAYDHLTMEERKELTEKMKAKFSGAKVFRREGSNRRR